MSGKGFSRLERAPAKHKHNNTRLLKIIESYGIVKE